MTAHDFTSYLSPAGHITVDVQVSSGMASGLKPYETAFNGSPAAVARELEELAADIRRLAQISTGEGQRPAALNSEPTSDSWDNYDDSGEV